MTYLLDADVLVRAKNQHYGFDFCPAFWDWLIAGNHAGKVFSVEKVNDELQRGADELSEWAADRGASFFLPLDESVVPTLTAVSAWATSRQYTPAAVSTFLQAADYYLVAQARAGGHAVVTHEVASASVNRIKIPDACDGLDVACVTPYGMLRRERARFILEPSP